MPSTSQRLDLNSVHSITDTLKAIPLSETPDDLFQQIMGAKQDMLERDYTNFPSTSENPTYKDYATIVVDRKVVAHIDNHGWLITSNAMAGAIPDTIIKDADIQANVASGPQLAQARAEAIAKYMNGTIVMASTAMSQNAYDALPQPTATVDNDAMKKDPRYEELEQLRQAHTAFLAQQMAQSDAIDI